MEYKNLVDLNYILNNKEKYVSINDLKKYAIERYKNFKKYQDENSKVTVKFLMKEDKENTEKSFTFDLDLTTTMTFIKNFFNIKDEDLK